ncbi:MAG: hypothetical protein HIU92_21915 [Proteobacteria bacterium]|nr:hypothetical protein [Pseudomonadota bacterium]
MRATAPFARRAALAGTTMMSGFAVDITQAVPDGALVEIDPTATPPMLRLVPEEDSPDAGSGA